jgi:hypothetical protein
MPNALDMFRAQREAADQVHARLTEVATLLIQLQTQVNALATNDQFRALLQGEGILLERTETLLRQIRSVREHEVARFWPAVWRRWVLAAVFALASAAAAGAGYGKATRPYASELETLRSRATLSDEIALRVLTMKPSERRQFDALIKWRKPPK